MTGDTERIAAIHFDTRSVEKRNPQIEHERAIAVYDLLGQNRFAPTGQAAGPYEIHLGVVDNRLMLDIRQHGGKGGGRIVRLSGQGEIRLLPQQGRQPFPDERVVIGDENAGAHAAGGKDRGRRAEGNPSAGQAWQWGWAGARQATLSLGWAGLPGVEVEGRSMGSIQLAEVAESTGRVQDTHRPRPPGPGSTAKVAPINWARCAMMRRPMPLPVTGVSNVTLLAAVADPSAFRADQVIALAASLARGPDTELATVTVPETPPPLVI